jgi:trimethylamine monooxygenase
MSSEQKTVLVIGAGPAGIAQCVVFAGQSNVKATCYEMHSEIGGLWCFSEQVGDDVHHSMYHQHRTNGLNEMLEMPDYSFFEHFGHPITSYPPRAVMLDYLKGWARTTGADQMIVLNRKVMSVEPDSKTNKFRVYSQDTNTAARHTAYFDHVVVCSGHFSLPNYPEPIPGLEDWKGHAIHSHNFRLGGGDYRGENVLIMGTGYSGEDIAMQCVKFGAASATVVHRTAPGGWDFMGWPIDEKSKHGMYYDAKDDKFHFADGSAKRYSSIIYCTGYKHNFPFLSGDLDLMTNNRLIPNTLWKGIVHPNNPALMFLGMPDQYYTFSFFHATAKFVLGVCEGKVSIPSKTDMLADTAAWQAREDALGDDHKTHHRFQYEHGQEAAGMVGAVLRDDSGHFDQWLDDRHHNILTYRDQSAVSSVSQTASLVWPVPWTEQMSDDTDEYLDWCRIEWRRMQVKSNARSMSHL